MDSPGSDPIEVFRAHFERAAAVCDDPDATVLATVDADGQPSARYVLLKSFDARGFVFFTNMQSRKARALAANGRAALCFYWRPLGVQVRIEGACELAGDAEADAYFATRPRDSQIGAWASAQSAPLASRVELETRVAEVRARFGDGPIARPAFWSGFRVVPHRIEFWTAGEARLHERELYERGPGGWSRRLLYP